MRLLSSLPVIALAACASSSPEPDEPKMQELAGDSAEPKPAAEDPAPAPTSPAGSYRSAHTIMVVCDKPDWCKQEVTDTLELADTGDGALAAKIELVQANAHICTFENTVTRVGDRRWQWSAPDGEPSCVLTLDWKLSSVVITSDGCREFCGARAVLDASFDYPPR
ncbi:MAG: hypothetical protein KJO07_05845 [Deltaproteobacteria bacterium]|nr:hypothetical protein [Deltaproteobacteria bacterium]